MGNRLYAGRPCRRESKGQLPVKEWGRRDCRQPVRGRYLEDGKGLSTADVMTVGAHGVPRKITWRNPKTGEEGEADCLFLHSIDLPDGAEPAVLDCRYYPSYVATDFYHHWEEGLALLHEMSFKAFRMSVAWSRIFPNGDDDEPNEEGLAFYERVFRRCKEYGIEPLVTLSHYETPLALRIKYNGFADRRVIDSFCRYAETVMRRFKGLVRYYLTFNEINAAGDMPYTAGAVLKDSPAARAQTGYNQLVASSRTVKLAH